MFVFTLHGDSTFEVEDCLVLTLWSLLCWRDILLTLIAESTAAAVCMFDVDFLFVFFLDVILLEPCLEFEEPGLSSSWLKLSYGMSLEFILAMSCVASMLIVVWLSIDLFCSFASWRLLNICSFDSDCLVVCGILIWALNIISCCFFFIFLMVPLLKSMFSCGVIFFYLSSCSSLSWDAAIIVSCFLIGNAVYYRSN